MSIKKKMPLWWVEKLRGPRPNTVGEKNHQWKGDKVGYGGVHMWIKKVLGQPTQCKHCGEDGFTSRKIHWANVSKKYLRDTNDWIRLCVSCHRKYDMTDEMRKNMSIAHKGKIPWNKGKKGVQAYTTERNKRISETLKRIGHKPQLFYK